MMRKKEEEERKISANPFHYYQPPRTDHMILFTIHGPSCLATLPHLKYSLSSHHKKGRSVFLPFPSSLTISTSTMESLSDTLWDVVISGTGLQQSLLAL